MKIANGRFVVFPGFKSQNSWKAMSRGRAVIGIHFGTDTVRSSIRHIIPSVTCLIVFNLANLVFNLAILSCCMSCGAHLGNFVHRLHLFLGHFCLTMGTCNFGNDIAIRPCMIIYTTMFLFLVHCVSPLD